MLRVYHTFLRQSEGQKLRPIRCYNTRSPSEPAKESRASPSLLGKLRDQRLLAGLLLLPCQRVCLDLAPHENGEKRILFLAVVVAAAETPTPGLPYVSLTCKKYRIRSWYKDDGKKHSNYKH